jgi:hypothetical protein
MGAHAHSSQFWAPNGRRRSPRGPLYQTTAGVDGIRFPDAFGPILVALIVAGAVTLAILRSRARARLVAPFAGRFNAHGTGTGPLDW